MRLEALWILPSRVRGAPAKNNAGVARRRPGLAVDRWMRPHLNTKAVLAWGFPGIFHQHPEATRFFPAPPGAQAQPGSPAPAIGRKPAERIHLVPRTPWIPSNLT